MRKMENLGIPTERGSMVLIGWPSTYRAIAGGKTESIRRQAGGKSEHEICGIPYKEEFDGSKINFAPVHTDIMSPHAVHTVPSGENNWWKEATVYQVLAFITCR